MVNQLIGGHQVYLFLKCQLGIYYIYLYIYSHPPFYDIEPTNIYKKILNGVIEFPKFLHVRAKDVIRKLLNSDVSKRLGVEDVRIKYNIN